MRPLPRRFIRAGAIAPVALIALLLAGCASAPVGPSLQALPGSRKTPEQFVVDDARCRTLTSERLAGRTPADAANQNVAASAAAGTAIGAATGAVFDGGSGAAAGAAIGLALGAIAGSNASSAAWTASQQQFDAAYYSCMYTLGHRVPVPAADVARYRAHMDSVAQGAAATGAPGEAQPAAGRGR